MGDVHFVIRHGLTGFIFLTFLLFGISLFFTVTRYDLSCAEPDPSWVEQLQAVMSRILPDDAEPDLIAVEVPEARSIKVCLMPDLGAGGGSIDAITLMVTVLTTAFLTTPVLGVIVQGIYTAVLYYQGDAWRDRARLELKDHILSSVNPGSAHAATPKLSDEQFGNLKDIDADPFFVWLYHTRAEPHMIEWARRRRSYHYLGRNWLIAAGLGISFGLAGPTLYYISPPLVLLSILAVVAVVWAYGTDYLSIKMKKDADDMEYVWALAQMRPDVFQGLVDSSASGSKAGSGAFAGAPLEHEPQSDIRPARG